MAGSRTLLFVYENPAFYILKGIILFSLLQRYLSVPSLSKIKRIFPERENLDADQEFYNSASLGMSPFPFRRRV